ncbi:MAG: ABC transporter substrate-binding protein [Acidimicrobiales bacterium]
MRGRLRTTGSRRRRATAVALSVATVGALALVGCSEDPPATSTSQGKTAAATCQGAELFTCAKDSTIGPYVPAKPTKATGKPLVIGMVNQENTAAGSYPELSQAVQAGIEFVNEQLGGVGGRPLELEVCNTEFSAEGSTSCGQQFSEEKVPLVLGGIDVFGNAIETLGRNGIPYLGGIPVSVQSVQAPNSFQWSGGTWGAAVAFAQHAATKAKAKRVSIVYGEFGSITHSAEVAQQVLDGYGVKVQLVPYPILDTDITSALNAAKASDPDAIFLLAADTGCKAGFDSIKALGIDAAKYFVGACAAPTIIDDLPTGETNGTLLNVEGPISRSHPNPDFAFYAGVIQQYGDGLDPVGAGTVSYRAFMNTYVLMRKLADADKQITPKAITDLIREQKDEPSFAGHPYTCDGKQFAGLPAMCSPQQILGRMQERKLFQASEWIDVGAIYQESGGVQGAD